MGVISFSLGPGAGLSPLLKRALERAHDEGVMIIKSAGNDNADSSGFGGQKAIEVYTVASHDENGVKAGTSNYGPAIDIWAPGKNVRALNHENVWSNDNSGTSFATPWVAGMAALIKGYEPKLPVIKVWERIQQNAAPRGVSNVPLGPTLRLQIGANHPARKPEHPYAFVGT